MFSNVKELVVLKRQNVQYCVEQVGDRKAWHRYRTPDGVRHRSGRAAMDHLDRLREIRTARNLEYLCKRWHCAQSSAR